MLYLVYAAVEIGTGLWAASVLVDSRGLDPRSAGFTVSCFYGGIMAGRFLTGLMAERAGNRRMTRIGLAVAIAGASIFAIGAFPEARGLSSILGLALLGLGCAPVYPCLMHETPRRYDEDTARLVVGRQVAFAYVGGALVPPAYGLLASRAGLEALPVAVLLAAILLLCLTEVLNRATRPRP